MKYFILTLLFLSQIAFADFGEKKTDESQGSGSPFESLQICARTYEKVGVAAIEPEIQGQMMDSANILYDLLETRGFYIWNLTEFIETNADSIIFYIGLGAIKPEKFVLSCGRVQRLFQYEQMLIK